MEGSSFRASCCSPSAEDVSLISFLLAGPLNIELCFYSTLRLYIFWKKYSRAALPGSDTELIVVSNAKRTGAGALCQSALG